MNSKSASHFRHLLSWFPFQEANIAANFLCLLLYKHIQVQTYFSVERPMFTT